MSNLEWIKSLVCVFNIYLCRIRLESSHFTLCYKAKFETVYTLCNFKFNLSLHQPKITEANGVWLIAWWVLKFVVTILHRKCKSNDLLQVQPFCVKTWFSKSNKVLYITYMYKYISIYMYILSCFFILPFLGGVNLSLLSTELPWNGYKSCNSWQKVSNLDQHKHTLTALYTLSCRQYVRINVCALGTIYIRTICKIIL